MNYLGVESFDWDDKTFFRLPYSVRDKEKEASRSIGRSAKGRSKEEFSEGLENTIAVLEVIPGNGTWYENSALRLEDAVDVIEDQIQSRGAMNVLMADGTVRRLDQKFDRKQILSMLTFD